MALNLRSWSKGREAAPLIHTLAYRKDTSIMHHNLKKLINYLKGGNADFVATLKKRDLISAVYIILIINIGINGFINVEGGILVHVINAFVQIIIQYIMFVLIFTGFNIFHNCK